MEWRDTALGLRHIPAPIASWVIQVLQRGSNTNKASTLTRVRRSVNGMVSYTSDTSIQLKLNHLSDSEGNIYAICLLFARPSKSTPLTIVHHIVVCGVENLLLVLIPYLMRLLFRRTTRIFTYKTHSMHPQPRYHIRVSSSRLAPACVMRLVAVETTKSYHCITVHARPRPLGVCLERARRIAYQYLCQSRGTVVLASVSCDTFAADLRLQDP